MRVLPAFIFLLLLSCNASKSPSSKSAVSDAGQPTEVETVVPKIEEPEMKVQASEDEESSLWKPYSTMDLPDLEKRIDPKDFKLWICDYDRLTTQLSSESPQVTLPTLGGMKVFHLTNSGTMSEELAEKFPNIKSFKGVSADGSISARVDMNDEGLFVEYNTPGTEQSYASPLLKGSKVYYAVYLKSALPNPGRDGSYK